MLASLVNRGKDELVGTGVVPAKTEPNNVPDTVGKLLLYKRTVSLKVIGSKFL